MLDALAFYAPLSANRRPAIAAAFSPPRRLIYCHQRNQGFIPTGARPIARFPRGSDRDRIPGPRLNERIRLSPVVVIDETGQNLGELDTRDALRMAQDRGVDLVEIKPDVRPPICKLMDYGKYKYEQSKKKHNKNKSHESKLKEVRMRPGTDKHDLEIKLAQARKFLEAGDKVQFNMRLRGREHAHTDLSIQHLKEMAEALGDIARVERPPLKSGRQITMLMFPGAPKKKDKAEGKPAERKSDNGQSANDKPAGSRLNIPQDAAGEKKPDDAAANAPAKE